MNGEKLSSAEVRASYVEEIQEHASRIGVVHDSEKALVDACFEALEAEGVLEEHNDLVVEAESIDAEMMQILKELTSDNVAHSFSDFHKRSLASVQASAVRYGEIKKALIKLVSSYDYEIPVNDEVVAPIDEVVETEAVPEEVVVPDTELVQVETKQPAPEVSAPTLSERYKSADSGVLKTPDTNGGEVFKEPKEIVKEAEVAYTEAGFNAARIAHYSNEVLKKIQFDIEALTDPVEKEKKYGELFEAVVSFFHTEQVDQHEGGDLELPQPTHEDVNEQLETLLTEYNAVKESIQNPDLKKRIEALVETIERYSETDVVRQTLDKGKYIEKLLAYLQEAKQESVAPENETVPVAEVVGKKHEDHFVLKATYKAKEKAYKAALADYYQDDSLRARLRNGADNTKELFLGIKAELPEHLQLLQKEYKQIRAIYADSLDDALLNRAEIEGNKAYQSDSNSTKAAFGTKFILNPNQEFISLQERSVLTPEQQVKVQNALRFLSKHKWTTRVGLVAMAGAAGAVTGGAAMALAGAGLQAGKLAASLGASTGVGFLAKKMTDGEVAKTAEAFTAAEKNVTTSFSLNDLEGLETALEESRFAKDITARGQRAAVIAGGIVTGGIVGGVSGLIDAETVDLSDTKTISYKNTPEIETIIETEEVAPTPAPALSEETVARQVAAERAPVVEVPAAPLTVSEITVPYEGLDNTKLSYETVLSDIKVVGAATEKTLSATERGELDAFLKLKAHDLLSAHPNISESKLETELFEKLQGKFGTASWWASAQITSIDIGSVAVRPVAALAETVTAATEAPLEVVEEPISGGSKITINDSSVYTEAGTATERVSDIYTVAKGDTLYGIAEKQFAAELKHLSPIERGQILDSLFDKVEQYPELKDSLNLRSGDVDLIYPDEKLNLSGLEAELDVLLERREIIEQFKNSAPLAVEADGEVKNIPITVVEKPIPGGTTVETGGASYTEAKPAVETTLADIKPSEVVPPPRPFALNGQYADQPAYKEYIQSVFSSPRAFEQAIERSVQNFDNTTYDVFERASIFGGNTFESPYRLLGEMSLAEVTEFEKQPNAEIRSFLNENNIKYDTYLAWLDKIDEMIQVLPNQAETKVSDLFTRYVVEVEVPKGNTLVK